MGMPKLSGGHHLLEKLVGCWEGEEMMHPSQWDPGGGVALGRTRTVLALGGFAAVSDYEQERDGAMVKLLLRHGADVNLRAACGTAVDVARANGHSSTVAILISPG